MLDLFTALVDADKLGGWVRAFVATLFGMTLPKLPILASIVGPDLQTAAGVLVSGLVVGAWSHYVKAKAA